jgi:hypothetical protein
VQCVLKREVFHKKNGEASLTESDALKNFISLSDNNETLTFGGSSSGITTAYPLESGVSGGHLVKNTSLCHRTFRKKSKR